MNRNKFGTIAIIVGILVVLGILFALPRFTDPTRAQVKAWNAAGIECLNQGHQNIARHFHPSLQILVDGEAEHIPANVGIVRTCMAEVHTHDPDNVLHVEPLVYKDMLLGDFFTVWARSIEREGFSLTMTVSDKPSSEFGDLVLEEGQKIVLEYVSETDSTVLPEAE